MAEVDEIMQCEFEPQPYPTEEPQSERSASPALAHPSDDEIYLYQLWTSFVAMTIYQNNPDYGVPVMQCLQRQTFCNQAQRTLWSRSQMAVKEWLRVWQAAWQGMPSEWSVAKFLLGESLDVVIDTVTPGVPHERWLLYRSTIIPSDYKKAPVMVLSSLSTAYCWKNLAYWASLPRRISMEVQAMGPVPLKDLNRITSDITHKLMPDIIFLYRSLPIWKGWLA